MNTIRITAALLTATTLIATATAQVPPGLNPGDSYRILVVTQAMRDATSANIADYDAFVQADVAASPLASISTNWRALASTPGVEAYAHTETDPNNQGVPVYLPNGIKITDDYNDLWDGNIQNAPNITTMGNAPANDRIWTGTSVYWGTAQAPLGNSDPTYGGNSLSGDPGFTGQIWMWANYLPQTQLHPLYAISDVITIAGHAERLGTPPMPDAFWIPQSPPVIGQTYQPFIDHEEFVEDAVLDFVFYGSNQINVAMPNLGTVLINNVFATETYVPTIAPGSFYPSAQVSLPLANDPNLLGFAASAQVLVLDANWGLHLTNAIDFVIGSN